MCSHRIGGNGAHDCSLLIVRFLQENVIVRRGNESKTVKRFDSAHHDIRTVNSGLAGRRHPDNIHGNNQCTKKGAAVKTGDQAQLGPKLFLVAKAQEKSKSGVESVWRENAQEKANLVWSPDGVKMDLGLYTRWLLQQIQH